MMKPLYRKRRIIAAFAVLYAVTACTGRPVALAAAAKDPVVDTKEETSEGNKENTDEESSGKKEEETTTAPEETEEATSPEEETTTAPKEETSDTNTQPTEPQTEGKVEETQETTGTTVSREEEENRSPEPNDRPTETETETTGARETEITLPDNSDKKPAMNAPTRSEEINIINVIVPVTYTMALNPYGLEVDMGDNTISTAQILSRNYGIVNKSSKDMVVTVSLTVEDWNGGGIRFVDSAEDAIYAKEDDCALYLTVVPSAGEIRAGGKPIDKDVEAAELSNVAMAKAKDKAEIIHSGTNEIAFRLSGAKYSFGEDSQEEGRPALPELTGLADDGAGVSAFTFDGAMNENADWSKASGGISMSVVYTYEAADEEESLAAAVEDGSPVD